LNGTFVARIAENGKMRYLGILATALEAAICYAREIGEERAAVEAAEGNVVVQPPLTANEARAVAAAEGLVLVPSSSNLTGFKGVTKQQGHKYQARIFENGKDRYLGRDPLV
jgi:hypothetical protein